jgi:hypothetical protein
MRMQAHGEVGDLRLARGVHQLGFALRQRRGHQEVLGGADGDLREDDPRAFQARRRAGVDVAAFQFDGGAELLQRLQVQVHWPRADGAAARQADLRFAVPGQQRAEDEHRGAHPAHDVIRGLEIRGRAGERDRPLALVVVHRQAVVP